MSKKERVKCKKCGLEYDVGAPHSAFCRGRIPEDAECADCGQDDKDFLKQCCECGDIICECCEEDGTHDCSW